MLSLIHARDYPKLTAVATRPLGGAMDVVMSSSKEIDVGSPSAVLAPLSARETPSNKQTSVCKLLSVSQTFERVEKVALNHR